MTMDYFRVILPKGKRISDAGLPASPIEHALFNSIAILHPQFGFAGMLPFDVPAKYYREAPVLYWTAQTWILDWPVDFVFLVLHPHDFRTGRIVVECDGHDFHERTKEQAARDRSRDRRLQGAGYLIFRFTGSEIYNNPEACAADVLEWARHARDAFDADKQEWLRYEKEPF